MTYSIVNPTLPLGETEVGGGNLINASGEILGYVDGAAGQEAVLWSPAGVATVLQDQPFPILSAIRADSDQPVSYPQASK